MAPRFTNLVRWMFALTFVGVGTYFLVQIVRSLSASPSLNISEWNWFILFPVAGLCVVLVLVPFGMGYLVYRRRYHELCSVLAMLGSIVLCLVLMSLPHRFGWYHALDWLDQTTIIGLLGLLISLLFLFGPFFAAVWFHRLCIRLADRYLVASRPRRWPTANVGIEK
jgi:hypothetical protein